MTLFDKGADDVLVDFKRARKTDDFTGLSLDVRSERQVIKLDTLRGDFPGQLYLAWDYHGVAAPVITGDKAKLEMPHQAWQPTACIIAARTKGVGNNAFSFMPMIFVAYISPLLIEFTDKPHLIQHNCFGSYFPWREFLRHAG